jgi:glycosyltransferase involved in cell wall biosynthesis
MGARKGAGAASGGRRVLQIIHSAEPGGVQTIAAEIGAGLSGANHLVSTRYLFPHLSAGKIAKMRGLLATAWHILRTRPDVIISYQSTASVLAGVMGGFARCPTRIIHQTALPTEVKPALRRLDRWAGAAGLYTANVVNCATTEAAFAAYPARYRQGLVRIDHGVAPPRPHFGRAETLARYAIPDDGPILLNVGRLTVQKNQKTLLAALPHLPKCHLVIAGGGPLEAQTRQLAADLGVGDRVHLLGDLAREIVPDLYGAADIFVFPSVWETFGLAAVEAALAGLPVVASDLPVLREVLRADETHLARFAPPSDAEAWRSAIAAALSDCGSGTSADADRARLQADYAPSRMIAAYRDLLRDKPRPA